MDKYVSIKEFSRLANVSVQSIYKRLSSPDNRLNDYFKQVEGQKMLDIQALKDIYNMEVKQPEFNNVEIVGILKQQLEVKDKQLETMAEQLQAKDKQLSDVVNQLTDTIQALKQSQVLQANSEKKLLEIEGKQANSEVDQFKKWWQFWK